MFAPSLTTEKVEQVKSNQKTQELLKATYFEISSPRLEKTQELENSTHSEVSSFTSDKSQEPKKSTHLDINCIKYVWLR